MTFAVLDQAEPLRADPPGADARLAGLNAHDQFLLHLEGYVASKPTDGTIR